MNIDYYKIKINLVNGKYKYIGTGSGRRVFDIGDGYVAKVAKNHKGIDQNKAEYSIAYRTNSVLLAPIFGISDDFNILIMMQAEKIKCISIVWNYYNVSNNYELSHMNELQDIISENNLIEADLFRPMNWGLIDGRPVVIDYGFTKDVKRKWYTFRLI